LESAARRTRIDLLMKTLLTRFADDFGRAVLPVFSPIEEAISRLESLSETTPAHAFLPGLRDARHGLHVLAEKVAAQQAYVLLFGPLKSGKSTLMNAISGQYVSEVTPLPAYPCIVTVGHGETVQARVARYDGATESFSDLSRLGPRIERAHFDLASRLREAEGRGEAFDPRLHLPEAIQRIDVRLPAAKLRESGALLVDTPGLYTRMKFGYDLMVRDFRETAASAIFVVKTDNLFLEQVFAEFEDLLRLFSRIFLVVNLDTTKRDLRPDGTLGPSLESLEPRRILEAFQDLSMSAALRAAAEDGRLQIYAIDLLRAASERLRGGEEAAEGEGGTEDASSTSFSAFLRDLAQFLNSTEYLCAFVRDSIRRADGLVEEVRRACRSEAAAGFGTRLRGVERERASAAELAESLERLSSLRWEEVFGPLCRQLRASEDPRIERRRDEFLESIPRILEEWFETDASLDQVFTQEIGERLRGLRGELAERARETLATLASGRDGGLRLPEELRRATDVIGLDLGTIGRRVLESLSVSREVSSESMRVPTREIPVRRSLVDWLLLRSRRAVRARLFGPSEAPTRSIPAATKHRRLAGAGRRALEAAIRERAWNLLLDGVGKLPDEIFEAFLLPVVDRIRTLVEQEKASVRERAKLLENRLVELRGAWEAIGALDRASGAVSADIGTLGRRYADARALPVEPEPSPVEAESTRAEEWIAPAPPRRPEEETATTRERSEESVDSGIRTEEERRLLGL
jgi:hypothetical protein